MKPELLDHILSLREVQSAYQPVISLRKARTIFEEALGRGRAPDGSSISPLPLLELARSQGKLSELDTLFVSSALEGWAPRSSKGILSVNIDASCIGPKTLPFLLSKTSDLNIQTNRIILEICENQSASPDDLAFFVNEARMHGFLIAIDDLGKEHSNLDRIISLAPHIIKLDRELIENVHQDSNKQALVRSMVRFCTECGAQVVAEGVEHWEEVFSLLEQGVDLFQGYFFARPETTPTPKAKWIEKTKVLGRSFRAHRMNSQRRTQEFRALMTELSSRACIALTHRKSYSFNRVLSRFVGGLPHIECIYLLDSWGEQVSITHFSPAVARAERSPLFSPADPGEDHSLKDYFLNLPQNGSYLSETYISQATGTPCRTFSHQFRDKEGQAYVLCVDIPESVLSLALA